MKDSPVKMLLSLDYELFFGTNSGCIEKCMVNSTQQLITLLDKYNYKVSLFVDAGFLLKLRQFSDDFPELAMQYATIQTQLHSLSSNGHDIQLHIHPHWQDSYYDGKTWIIDTQRYRLHNFNATEINDIVRSYKQELELCTEQPVFAFRAGGWCLQPFKKIQRALQDNGIWLDSTVFSHGHSDDPTRWFDFKNIPKQAYWHFTDDPLIATKNGYFTEVPISATKTSPPAFLEISTTQEIFSRCF